ncbi:site-specific DNA-methyltransferase [Aerococcus urinaeequi]|uniref:site-specific DNA-methyltransferase n=1 Tax=Aerococcus urinaeequi TaxID=51665 RepID=UPI003D6B7490
MSELKPMSGETLDLTKENIEKLKELFPEVLTEEQIDFEKLRLILGDVVNDKPEKYSFTWNGKNDAIKLAQQPSTGTLRPNKEKSKNWETTENLYIEGDNLEVLKLLQKSYAGKVKVIYIDPPYNTGKDFVYKDNFKENIKNYFEQTGQLDNEGNKLTTNHESNGRFHTDWLNMMYTRLILAKNLLTEDGVIFISIDDKELGNLKTICNELFGENNFIANLVWTNKEGGGSSDSKNFRIKHEYILCYAKNIQNSAMKGLPVEDVDRYREKDEYEATRGKHQLIKLDSASLGYIKSLDYPINAPDGTIIYPNKGNEKISRWRWSKQKFEWGIKNGYVVIKKDRDNEWAVYTKQYLNADNAGNIIERTIKPLGVIDEFSTTMSNKEMKKLMGGAVFPYSKPTSLIKFLLQITTGNNDLILDFFAGSSTTAHATIELNVEDKENRKFIMVQLPEPTSEKDIAYDEGYKNISDISQERIRRAGEKIIKDNQLIEGELDTGFKVFELDNSNIQKWNINSENIEESLFAMANNFVEGRSHADIVYEVLLKLGLDLNIPFEEKTMDGSTVYDVAFGNVYVVLGENITQEVAKYIANKQKEYENENPSVVFNDNGFKNDNEKLNSIEILKNNGFNEEQLMSI